MSLELVPLQTFGRKRNIANETFGFFDVSINNTGKSKFQERVTILPNSTWASCTWGGSTRSWREFFEKLIHPDAVKFNCSMNWTAQVKLLSVFNIQPHAGHPCFAFNVAPARLHYNKITLELASSKSACLWSQTARQFYRNVNLGRWDTRARLST